MFGYVQWEIGYFVKLDAEVVGCFVNLGYLAQVFVVIALLVALPPAFKLAFISANALVVLQLTKTLGATYAFVAFSGQFATVNPGLESTLVFHW